MKIKALFLLLAVLLVPTWLRAQTHTFPAEDTNNTFTGTNTFQNSVFTKLVQYTIGGTLPVPAVAMSGLIVVVTNGNTTADCTVGGGSLRVLCTNTGSAWVSLGGSVATGITLQTNTANNTDQTTLNFQTSVANAIGLVITPSNPSGGNERFEITGSYSGPINTAGDNSWSGNQRFGGGNGVQVGNIPWRDFTNTEFGMPAGGCSSTNNSDPDTTGTIVSGTNILNLSSAIDFINGCGITVYRAGATSTMIMPSSCTASASQGGGVVTFTCSAAHHLTLGNNTNTQDESLVVTGCTDASFDGTYGMIITGSSTTVAAFSGHSGTATGCNVSFLNGWIHGASGSTTYYYKFAAADARGGLSAAVGPVTIASSAMIVQNSPNYRSAYAGGTAYAVNDEVAYNNFNWVSLTSSNTGHQPDISPTNWALLNENYNWLGWALVNNSGGVAKMVCIYRSTDNVTYIPVGTSVTAGWTDRGLPSPVWPGCGTTPPAAQTAQQLTTTITGGAGSTTLTLAATASNNATSQNVYHDETLFLTACLTAASADQAGAHIPAGSHGCLVPAGQWNFNSDWPTDSTLSSGGSEGGLAIYVDGTIALKSWPILFTNGNWYMQGQGNSGGGAGDQHFPTTYIGPGVNVPMVFALLGDNITIHNFSLTNLSGDGIDIATPVGTDSAPGEIDLDGFLISSRQINSGIANSGVPIKIDSNTLFVYGRNLSLFPNFTGIPASILFTSSTYNGNTWCCMNFDRIFTEWHGAMFEAPGGVNIGRGAQMQFNSWESEEHGQYSTCGFICVDTGNVNGTPGAGTASPNIPSLTVAGLDNADSSNKQFLVYKGQNIAGLVTIIMNADDEFNPLVGCTYNSATCSLGIAPTISSDGVKFLSGVQKDFVGPGGTNGNVYYILRPMVLGGGNGDIGGAPPNPVWSDALPPPNTVSVSSVSSGSLPAGQYCMEFVGLDAQTSTSQGYTLASPEICQSVGASSDIVLAATLPQTGNAYKDFYLLYGPTPGGEVSAIDTSIVASFANSITYTFTSTSGNFPFTPPLGPTAYLSWLYRDVNKPSCLLCSAANSIGFQLGIGDIAPPSGEKVSIKGGGLGAPYLQMLEASAASGVASSDVLYPDSSAHRLKMNNNNGSADTVAGLSDFAAPPAIGGTTPAAGTFTNFSSTGGNTFGSAVTYNTAACETSFGITALSGASTTTGLNCLPANAVIDAVVYRVTTTITTATSFTIGDSGSATRYCGTQSTLTAGTTGTCTAQGYYLNASALGVKVTPSTSPGAGAIRLIVYYHTWVAPTS